MHRIVIVLCAAPRKIKEIMLAAEELQMTSGEYVFFNIELLNRFLFIFLFLSNEITCERNKTYSYEPKAQNTLFLGACTVGLLCICRISYILLKDPETWHGFLREWVGHPSDFLGHSGYTSAFNSDCHLQSFCPYLLFEMEPCALIQYRNSDKKDWAFPSLLASYTATMLRWSRGTTKAKTRNRMKDPDEPT